MPGLQIMSLEIYPNRFLAMEAGTFDQAQYDEIKQQLYQKSVNDSMKCYEGFILQENFYDANICLQTWRMHSKELGTYDKEEYEALKERLKQARAAKAARKAEEKKAAETEPWNDTFPELIVYQFVNPP